MKQMVVLLMAITGFGQEQQKPIQDLNLLIGKRVTAQRVPLCQPGTYTHVLTYAGKQAIVVSLKPLHLDAMSQNVMDRLPPETRATIEDYRKAATLLVQFDDGTQLDTCTQIPPSKLADYFELAPGETLPNVQHSPTPPRTYAPVASIAVTPPAASPVTSAAQADVLSTLPQSAGFYYQTSQGWQKLEPLSMAGGGLTHMGKMFVPGLTPQMVWTFRDAESPVQITEKNRHSVLRNCLNWRTWPEGRGVIC